MSKNTVRGYKAKDRSPKMESIYKCRSVSLPESAVKMLDLLVTANSYDNRSRLVDDLLDRFFKRYSAYFDKLNDIIQFGGEFLI